MTAGAVAQRETWKKSLENVFDIAHQKALELIQIDEDKLFLLAQREEGRRGKMMGADRQLAEFEQRQLTRAARDSDHRTRKCSEKPRSTLLNSIPAPIPRAPTRRLPAMNTSLSHQRPPPAHRRRGRKTVVSPTVAAALDRTHVTDRQAVT